MKVFSTTLDISLVYGLILFLSCLVLFSIFEIYYDRRKNVWNINGPFPLPLFGTIFVHSKYSNNVILLLGNSLLFAKPHEEFMPTIKAVSIKHFQSIV